MRQKSNTSTQAHTHTHADPSKLTDWLCISQYSTPLAPLPGLGHFTLQPSRHPSSKSCDHYLFRFCPPHLKHLKQILFCPFLSSLFTYLITYFKTWDCLEPKVHAVCLPLQPPTSPGNPAGSAVLTRCSLPLASPPFPGPSSFPATSRLTWRCGRSKASLTTRSYTRCVCRTIICSPSAPSQAHCALGRSRW